MNFLENWWGFLLFTAVNFIIIFIVARFIWPIWRRNELEKRYEETQRLYQESQERIEELETTVNFLLGQLKLMNIELDRLKNVKSDGGLHLDNRYFLAAFGAVDEGLELDLTSFRAIFTETGIEFQTVIDCTPQKLKAFLDRARLWEKEIYLSLSVHARPEGLELGGELVDATWLSGILGDSTKVLVIAGCESDRVGDFLGVVPYVVSMSQKVPHNDAAIFIRVFWTAIVLGDSPDLALRKALRRSPPMMREYVIKHW